MTVLFTFLGILSQCASAQLSPSIEIYKKAALDIIDKDQTILTLGEGYSWSEGPVWVDDGEFLLFSDVPNNIIYKYKEGEGVQPYLTPSGATGLSTNDSQQGANGLLINQRGQLVIMQHGDRRVAIMDASTSAPQPIYEPIVSAYQGKRLNSPNDGVFRSNGDLYFTDPPYGLRGGDADPHKEIPFHGIYRLASTGQLSLEDDSVSYPNGVVLTTDESRLIVAASDQTAAKWYQYDVNEKGELFNKRVFHDASSLVGKDNEKGLPDGMVVHSKGYIFATGPGGVFIFAESGQLLAKIRTGKATANCTLSQDEKTLYMTAHDTLMSVRLK